MAAHEKHIVVIKADQQGAKLVDPGERALAGEAVFVDFGVKQASAAPFGLFAIALVLRNIGDT